MDEAEGDGTALESTEASPSAVAGLLEELVVRRAEVKERDLRLAQSSEAAFRAQAQLGDLSHRLGGALALVAEERREREALQRQLDSLTQTRAWRIFNFGVQAVAALRRRVVALARTSTAPFRGRS